MTINHILFYHTPTFWILSHVQRPAIASEHHHRNHRINIIPIEIFTSSMRGLHRNITIIPIKIIIS